METSLNEDEGDMVQVLREETTNLSVNSMGEWVMYSFSATTNLINPSLNPHNFKGIFLKGT